MGTGSTAPRSSGLGGAFGHVDRRSVGHLGCLPALLPTFGKRLRCHEPVADLLGPLCLYNLPLPLASVSGGTG